MGLLFLFCTFYVCFTNASNGEKDKEAKILLPMSNFIFLLSV